MKVIEQLRLKFPNSQVLADVSSIPRQSNVRYIAIGAAALQSLLVRDIEDPIFALLVPRLTFKELVDSAGKSRASNVTAIYAEASPEAQMQLAQRLFKRETRIAVLYSSKTAYLLGPLRQAASQANLRVEFIAVDEEGINRALNQAGDAAAILAIPDDTIYNSQNIRTILLSTYQRGQPVLGFSTSLVKAGALGTTYSTVEDMVTQVAEQIHDYAANGRTPSPQYPRYFSVLINDSVSRSLNVVVDDQVRRYANLAPASRRDR
jgi:ABC-type uncharacterized transport system substrate-binding protein